jgi:hypothetical protein
MKRVVARFARAPLQLEHVDQTVAVLGTHLEQEIGNVRAELASLHAMMNSLNETVTASSKANLDSLIFMNRSIEDLSIRLEKLVKDMSDQPT